MDAAHYREAIRLLAEGRFREAWPLYEARRAMPGFSITEPAASCPEWRGEDLTGKRVLVCVEQGLGDQIQFGRFLPQLASAGAEVVVFCNPAYIARFFEAAGFKTSPWFTDRPAPTADYWVMIGSLPGRLGVEIAPARYLDIPVQRQGGIGVKPTGNPDHWNDAHRSLPPSAADQLLTMGRDLSPTSTGAVDLLDTARIIAGLDLVISVDTAVAHLAGAIGTPCWVLLPHTGLDWRWGDGLRSPWYPQMRLFRQSSPSQWSDVLQDVRAALDGNREHIDRKAARATCAGGDR